jgi:hypothetical protein
MDLVDRHRIGPRFNSVDDTVNKLKYALHNENGTRRFLLGHQYETGIKKSVLERSDIA